MRAGAHTIYTIGHSVHPIEHFITLLQSFNISLLADVRSFPGSARHPQYNSLALAHSLKEAGIHYTHIPLLGGKTNGSYTSYMLTDGFKKGIQMLEDAALMQDTVYMCAEANWQHCHRSYISDHLKAKEWNVLHIQDAYKTVQHPDRIRQGKLFK